METVYQAPKNEGAIQVINAELLQKAAEKVMPKGAFDYIACGSGAGVTLRRNMDAFEEVGVYPRVLEDFDAPETKTEVLGIKLAVPFITAPMAVQGLAHDTAERGTAAGTAVAGSLMAISTYSNDTLDEIAKAGGGAPQWFQLYLSKDEKFNRYMIDDAKQNGMKAIVLTVDATVGGNREADEINQFKMPLKMGNLEKAGAGQGMSIEQIFANAKQKIAVEDVRNTAAYSGLPVIVKGIQYPDDAQRAIDAGAAAVWVSNHGGRQLDGAPGSFEVLSEIAAVVNRQVPIIFDSGIRRAEHIFKALASGADITALGRPVLYGLALGGADGVKSVYDYYATELKRVMQLAGCKTVEDIRHAQVKTEPCQTM